MRVDERIDLLKQIADRLATAEVPWEDVTLTLGQYGVKITDPDYWEGNARSYVLAQLRPVPDETVIAIGDYVLGNVSEAATDPADLPWELGTFRLFVSHTSPNAALAERVREYFARWRIDAFVAHATIDPTREWERVIEAALGSCTALVALITDDFVTSRWCDQEVGFCLGRKVPVIPVRLGADPHGFIAKYQAARVPDGKSAPKAADVIFRALAMHSALRELIAAPVVFRFAATQNFDGARANFALLQDVQDRFWTRDMVETAELAIDKNSQLRDAVLGGASSTSLPEATRELLAPIRQRLGMNETQIASAADDDIPF